jgi:hypothetical protein
MKPPEDLLVLGAPDETSDVIEVPLLLSGWQMSALERAAYLRGLTAAEMVRQLLREFIADQP